MISFRNRIVHDYAEVDSKKVHAAMTTNLQGLDDFIMSVIEYLHL